MKLLFFDMEFADGRVPGSIYSLGYLMTDGEFRILEPQTDLLINPNSTWNEYVEANILAYPKEEVEAAPEFCDLFPTIKALFERADLAVGFSTSNDTRAMRKACERYGIEPFSFRCFDTEKLCRKMEEHRDAHGLGGCVVAWCGEKPDNRHRSDGDAYATMMLLRAICRAKHATPEMIVAAYPECESDSLQKKKPQAPKKKKRGKSVSRRPRKKRPENSSVCEAKPTV
ncbi:MAG: 3'-5' exonuclease [Clostridia bacterium]|nr:3'-5' exonuclease [Clostridia bacterium]